MDVFYLCSSDEHLYTDETGTTPLWRFHSRHRRRPRGDSNRQGLYGQSDLCWEAAGDLRDPVSDEDFARGMTWDVRLALALLEATSDPQIGGQLWPVYGRLLPQPHTITVTCEALAPQQDIINRGRDAISYRKKLPCICVFKAGLAGHVESLY